MLASVAVALLLLEGALRVLDVRSASYHAIGGFCRWHPVLGWELVPDRRATFKGPSFSVTVRHSPQGLRDRVYPVPRRPGTRRILVLGDSVVWGWGVEQHEIFTEVLERSLPRTEVIAAGVPGYGTTQELLLYERRLRRFRPDVVVLALLSNDPAENLLADARPRMQLRNGRLHLSGIPVPRRKSPAREWLKEHSRLFGQLDHAAGAIRARLKAARQGVDVEANEYLPLDPAQSEDAWRLTRALVERLHDAVRADGGQVVVLTHDIAGEALANVRDFCTARGIDVLEAGSLDRLRGDPHPSAAGHRQLAARLVALPRSVLLRQREVEHAAHTRLGLHPDRAAVLLDDLLRDGQPQAGSFVLLGRVQLLEEEEDGLTVLGSNADAVVADGEVPVVARILARDGDLGWAGTGELDGVSHQVAEHLRQLRAVATDDGQVVARDPRARPLDGCREISERVGEGLGAVHVGRDASCAELHLGVGQEVPEQSPHALHAARDESGQLDGLLPVLREPPDQELREAVDRAQGLLQVLGHRVGETLQLFVRLPKSRGLRPPARCSAVTSGP